MRIEVYDGGDLDRDYFVWRGEEYLGKAHNLGHARDKYCEVGEQASVIGRNHIVITAYDKELANENLKKEFYK